MKAIIYSVLTILLVSAFSSCGKDDVVLVASEYKNLSISCGLDFEIPVLASDWCIESVQSSGIPLVDEQNNPLALDGFGKVEAANKWFALERNEDGKFIVHLKENFEEEKRSIVICINNNGDRDYVTLEQSRGESYRLVEKSFQEIEELREVYVNDDGCHPFAFTNHSSSPIWESESPVFSDVVYTSEFNSDDYGAFDWLSPDEDLEITLPDIIIDGMQRANKTCVYKSGISIRPDDPYENKTLVQAYATIYFSGKVLYCKRHFNYVFTIENESTHSRFDIKGTCMQISPLTKTLIISDKEK